jgi:eukaryotic-like serine/threonine-protein kinase
MILDDSGTSTDDELQDELLEELLAVDAAIAAGASPDSIGADPWVGDCLRILERIFARAPAAEVDLRDESSLPLGRFDIVRPVGRGGFGIVFQARDLILGRDVALKIPRPGTRVTPEVRRRFMREARATAVLDHPNIVPVYEAKELGPIIYIASAFCDGPSLSSWLKGRTEPVPARIAARLIADIAGALQHAHDRGILHRDLKPSNVMLQIVDGDSNDDSHWPVLIPRVTDFGLAKLAVEESDDTRSGVVHGSPPYMAPEQATGRASHLGPTTDVYGLGATLYEILTGRPPFRGETPVQTIRQVQFDEPISPRLLRPDAPRDLETICLHCLNKDQARRYPSAEALSEDLERFLSGLPIHARPATVRERAQKWIRRRPSLSALILLLILVVSGTAGQMAWSNAWLREHNSRLQSAIARADRHASDAHQQRKLALAREALSDRHLHAAQLRLARQACDVGQFERAQEVLLDDVNGPGPRYRDFAWNYLWQFSRREVALLGRHDAPIRGVDLSPDGRTLASCDASGRIILWDPISGQARAKLDGHAGTAGWLAFSADGKLLASCGDRSPSAKGQKNVLLWDVTNGRLVGQPLGIIRDEVRVMTFLNQGQSLAIVSCDSRGARTIRVWDLTTSGSRSPPRYVVAGFGFVACSPTGRFFAVRESDGRLTLRDASDGEVYRTVSEGEADASSLAISPDGLTLAASASPNRILLWDLDQWGAPRVFSDEEARPDRLVFSPDGSTLVALVGGQQVSLRDIRTGHHRVIVSLSPTRGGTFHLAFSRDGTRLALDGDGHPGGALSTMIWNVRTGQQEHLFPGRRSFQYLSFDPLGQSVFLGGDHDLSIWRPSSPNTDDAFADHHDEVWSLAFSPDGKTIASGGDDEAIRLWDPATCQEKAVLRSHEATISSLAFRPDGRVIASASLSFKNNLKLWDVATGRVIATLDGHTDRVRSVAFDPSGHILASAGSDRLIRLWHGHTGQAYSVLRGHDEVVRQVVFSPDGRALASASNDRTIRLWDVTQGRTTAVLPGLYKSTTVAFSPDGLTLASADENGYITLWDVATRAKRRVINGDDEEMRALVFSPDGMILASAGVSREVRLWDPATGQELLSLSGNLGQVNALAFSPSGEILATADHTGLARLYRGSRE